MYGRESVLDASNIWFLVRNVNGYMLSDWPRCSGHQTSVNAAGKRGGTAYSKPSQKPRSD
jgi:hypothetical protein